MPLIENSTYKPPRIFRNAHLNTIYPALFRKVEGVDYERERLATPDGDFIDLDWSRAGCDKVLIALHGLEGGATRPYIRGIIRRFNRAGWDGVGMNFRSCSGEPNRKPYSYHMGATSDLEWVVRHVLASGGYRAVALAGFSLGGNVVLRYLGERPDETPDEIKAAVAFSVPCHISSANQEIEKWFNYPYLNRFMKSLNQKMEIKARQFPEVVRAEGKKPSDFQSFDNRYTAPLHGFKNAEDYWARCSSLPILPAIRIPTLLVNAMDDTFLSAKCYPYALAEKQPNLYLETPQWGGHTGFVSNMPDGVYWSEERALQFVESR